MTAPAHVAPITEPSEGTSKPRARRQAVELLARSFQHQPHFIDLFPDPDARERALPHVFAALYRDALTHGRIDAATKDGELVGVAVWYPPRKYPLSARRQLAALPDIARLAVTAVGSLRRVLQFQASAARLHPEQPYAYLAAVGVDPSAQGAGVGRRLLESGLARADAAGDGCYLETHTPALVAWYQQLGFEVRHGEVAFTSGGPPNWTMQRPAGRP